MLNAELVVFLRIENPRSNRLAVAQAQLEESILSFGLTPLRFPAGPDLTPIGDVLTVARPHTPVWLWSAVK
jgi:hypothetical protein